MDCEKASALLRSNQPPIEIKTSGMLIAAQVYQPNLLITEFHGPLTIAEPGKPPSIVANWKLAQSSVRGTPQTPERVSLAVDGPVVDRINGGARENLLHAKHIEIHGRIVEGSVTDHPVIEVVTRLTRAAAPTLHPAASHPLTPTSTRCCAA